MSRGRTSDDARTAANLRVLDFTQPLTQPPEYLSADESDIFRTMAGAMPAGWFKADTVPLLVEYSRAIDACNKLAKQRDEPMSVKERAVLLGCHEKQARLAINLATKLRLTHQSRVLPDQAGRDAAKAPVAAPPWASGQSETRRGSKNIAATRTGS